MLDELLFHLDGFLHSLHHTLRKDWTSPTVGLVTAGLVLLLGHCLAVHRRKQGRHPFCVKHPHLDPFLLFVSERRHCSRRSGGPLAVLISDEQARTALAHGQVIDISQDGLRLSVPWRIRTGTILRVRRDTGAGSSAWIELRVKHCCHQEGTWVLGGQFHAASAGSGLVFD